MPSSMIHEGITYFCPGFSVGERVTFPTDEELGSHDERLRFGVLRFMHAHPLEAPFEALGAFLQTRQGAGEAEIREVVAGLIAEGQLENIEQVPLRSMDLSITNQCNAGCIYCPTPRNRQERRYLARTELEQLLEELTDTAFIDRFGRLELIEVGGLFEPLLHPEFLDLLRCLQRRYATRRILHTNGSLLGEALSRALLEERLIDELVVSIDGLTEEEHQRTRHLSLGIVEAHLEAFLERRATVGAACAVTIQVMSYQRYCEAVQRILGRSPLAVLTVEPGPEDTTTGVMRRWAPRLDAGDEVVDAMTRFQLRGEYQRDGDTASIPEEQLRCPWLSYVAHALNITSSGEWIICCNDFFAESSLGNVLAQPLEEIASGPRVQFLRALAGHDDEHLPPRCARKLYCQYLT